MLQWSDALRVRDTDLYLDSRDPRPKCVISHAHSDHLASHETTIATPATLALLERRVELRNFLALPFHEELAFDPQTQIRLFPAGHVLGSAMVRVTRPEGTLLYTGDFKLRPSLTADAPQVPKADVLVMESTYGQPLFRFPPWREVADQLVDLAQAALRDGRQPIVMGYSLGKAQEIVRILTDAGLPVTVHGAIANINQIYLQLGVNVGACRSYRLEDFHGAQAVDLKERGVLVAPPQVARSAFVTRFKNPCRIVLSGWSMLKNAIYRYGVDHALPLSDHADFDELLELIERVQPRKIYTHHGYREFAEILKARGMDAECARPDEQMQLFPG